tara:strand:- start:614 stop:784 length:171 start_codon:yes stop_codon:yes gene_type:complete
MAIKNYYWWIIDYPFNLLQLRHTNSKDKLPNNPDITIHTNIEDALADKPEHYIENV